MTLRCVLTGLALAGAITPPLLHAAAPMATSSPLAQRHRFSIPAQPLGAALRQLSDQSGIRILYPYEAVTRIRSRPVKGWLTTRDALEQLLAGTALQHRETGHGVIALSVPEGQTTLRRPLTRQLASGDQ
jgi:iron complex outermembrane receptor protein